MPANRGPWQFSLRSLLVLVVLVGLGCVVGRFANDKYQEYVRREKARIQFEKTRDLWDTPVTPAIPRE